MEQACSYTAQSLVIQVYWQLNERNEKREFKGLVQACFDLNIGDTLILTYNQEFEKDEGGIQIKVLPAWKWLIQWKTEQIG